MEKDVEFWVTPEGKVMYKLDAEDEKVFSLQDKKIIDEILQIMKERYPHAFRTLSLKYAESKRNNYMFNFRIVDHFLRCNFGEHDLLTKDISLNFLHFEEVRCPLRGICKDENIVCKPKPVGIFKPAEKQVVELYSKGFSMSEIATILKKSANTVNVQLYRIKKKLKLNKCHDIIKVVNMYDLK